MCVCVYIYVYIYTKWVVIGMNESVFKGYSFIYYKYEKVYNHDINIELNFYEFV